MTAIYTLKQAIAESYSPSDFQKELDLLTPEQKTYLENLVIELHQKGVTKPLQWAISELKDEYPTLVLFDFIRELKATFADVESNVEGAKETCPDAQEIFETMCETLGKEKAVDFLQAYGNDIGWTIVNMLDEGNIPHPNRTSMKSWVLAEVDSENNVGRAIYGLHENWYEFNEE